MVLGMEKWTVYRRITSSLCNSAAAAAKSLQSCPTLCDPIDGSPPGSSVPGTLQARILEWVAISFSKACMHAKSLQSCPTLCNFDICQTHFWGRWLIFKDGNQNFPGDPVVKNPPSNAGNVGLIPAQGTKIHMQLESLWAATTELLCSRVRTLQQEKPTHTIKEPMCRKGRPSTANPPSPQIKNSKK